MFSSFSSGKGRPRVYPRAHVSACRRAHFSNLASMAAEGELSAAEKKTIKFGVVRWASGDGDVGLCLGKNNANSHDSTRETFSHVGLHLLESPTTTAIQPRIPGDVGCIT